MKFEIHRTSDLFNEKSPCPEAILAGRKEWENKYEVELNTLEELMAFVSKYGLIVLSSSTIEIYDAYRE